MNVKDILDSVMPAGGNGSDIFVFRMIAAAMGTTLLACVVGSLILAALDRTIPASIGMLMGAIAGSFCTMLVPGPYSPGKAQDKQRIFVPK